MAPAGQRRWSRGGSISRWRRVRCVTPIPRSVGIPRSREAGICGQGLNYRTRAHSETSGYLRAGRARRWWRLRTFPGWRSRPTPWRALPPVPRRYCWSAAWPARISKLIAPDFIAWPAAHALRPLWHPPAQAPSAPASPGHSRGRQSGSAGTGLQIRPRLISMVTR